MATVTSQDTEITLGLGKMLALFFGLVILCAVFFGMGFSLGRNSEKGSAFELSPATPAANGAHLPAVKPAGLAPSDSATLKTAESKTPQSQPAPATAPASSDATAQAEAKPAPSDPALALAANAYYVQVAAVSKQEDAEALVDALKKKNYPAFSLSAPPDTLYHVQLGPYGDVKDAELMRAKLVSDGYNPILKR